MIPGKDTNTAKLKKTQKKKINPFLTLSFYESPQLQKKSAEIFVKDEYIYSDKLQENIKRLLEI